MCLILLAASAQAFAAAPRALDPGASAALSSAPADLQAFVADFYSATLGQNLDEIDPEFRPHGWAVNLDGDPGDEWILFEPFYSGMDVQTAMILDSADDGWRIIYRETGPFLVRIDATETGGLRDITGVYNVAPAPRGGYGMFRTRLAWNGAQYVETDPPLAYYRVVSDLPMPLYVSSESRAVQQAFDLVEPGACVAATTEGDERFTENGADWLVVNRPVPGYAPAQSLAPEPRCELAFAFARMLFESAAGPFADATPDKAFEPTEELTAWVRRRLAPRVTLQFCKAASTDSPREIAIHRVLEDLPFAVSRPFQDARSFFPYFAPAAPDDPQGAVAIRFKQYYTEFITPVSWIFALNPDTGKFHITSVRHACDIPIPKAEPEPEPVEDITAQSENKDNDRLSAWEENYASSTPQDEDSKPDKAAAGQNAKDMYPGSDDVIPRFFRSLNRGRLETAYAMLSDDFKAATSFESFESEYAARSGCELSKLRVSHVGDNVFEAKFELSATEGTQALTFMGKARFANVGGEWFITFMDLFKMDW
jgi:hypothetical protein